MHLTRRRQYTVVIAIREYATRAARNPIHGTCESNAYRFHAASERVAILSLDNQVRVVAEQRIVHQAKIAAIAAGRKGPLYLPHDADVAEGRQSGLQAQGHVRGQSAKGRAPHVTHHRAQPGLPTGPGTGTAPTAGSREGKWELSAAF